MVPFVSMLWTHADGDRAGLKSSMNRAPVGKETGEAEDCAGAYM